MWSRTTQLSTVDPSYLVVVRSPLDRPSILGFEVFSGLQSMRVVASAKGNLHISVWNSSEDFDRSRNAFLSAMCAQQTEFEGAASPNAVRNAKKPRSYSTYILSAVAILGALEALSHRYEEIFSYPDAWVRFEQREYRLTQGQHLTVKATIENLLPVANMREIHLESSVIGKGQASVSIAQKRIPAIGPGKERVVPVDADFVSAGSYDLRLTVSGCAGILWCWTPKTFYDSTRVRVYPKLPVARARLVANKVTATTAEVAIHLETGIELKSSAHCELTFAPGPPFAYRPQYQTLHKFEDPIGSDGRMRAVLDWRVGAVAARDEARDALHFVAPAPVNWVEILEKATFDCSSD